jgi:hypothetical protein
MMMEGKSRLCQHCQKGLDGQQKPDYLYCGHNRVLAYRCTNGQMDFISVQSTREAVRIIQDADQLTGLFVVSA